MKRIILLSLILVLSGCGRVVTKANQKHQNPSDTLPEIKIEEPVIVRAKYNEIDVTAASDMIKTNPELTIIDTSPKFANGHIPGAVNYYVGGDSLDKAIVKLDKNSTYLVYADTDSASSVGAQKLADAGIKNVYRLVGNFSAWTNANLETKK